MYAIVSMMSCEEICVIYKSFPQTYCHFMRKDAIVLQSHASQPSQAFKFVPDCTTFQYVDMKCASMDLQEEIFQKECMKDISLDSNSCDFVSRYVSDRVVIDTVWRQRLKLYDSLWEDLKCYHTIYTFMPESKSILERNLPGTIKIVDVESMGFSLPSKMIITSCFINHKLKNCAKATALHILDFILNTVDETCHAIKL